MKTAILANGLVDSLSILLPSIHRQGRLVAVDGGLRYCKEGALTPQLLIGDFDSCPKELLEDYSHVERITLPKDKDVTDTEAAILHELSIGVKQITLYAAWGKRIDHSLTNALILGRYPGIVSLETETELVFAIRGKTKLHCKRGQTLSLIPIFGKASHITTSGLKWELKGGELSQNFIGISNICLREEIGIEVGEGTLLCCLN